jgi:hypothetical protein
MQLTEELKKELEKLYRGTPDDIHGVSLGYKYKNGEKTEEIGIVFNVDKKLSESDLSEDKILPKSIRVGEQDICTDVREVPRSEMLSCYCSSDPCPDVPNITNLRAAPLPMRGGQQIIQFPTNWTPASGGLYNVSVGTLGFFCVDNIDNKIVGVTNSHVVCYRRAFAFDRSLGNLDQGALSIEYPDPYNTVEARSWVNGQSYNPGALISDNSTNTIAGKIKRYQPVSMSGYNYSDVALLSMSPSVISSANSYKVWQPIGTTDYTNFLPFASTAEINNLLVTNPRVYSTGRTTGPKGYANTSTCRLRITSIGNYLTVGGYDISDWGDIMSFDYEDFSSGAVLGGDSGSALLADISGVRKIIGLVFAGNGTTGDACRIDRVAADMNIRAWDGTYDSSLPTSLYGVVTDFSNSKSSQASLVYGGKTYYQVGFTKTTGLPQIN